MTSTYFWIALFSEIGPVSAFFIFYQFHGFFSGVFALVVTTTLSLIISRVKLNRIPLFSLCASVLVLAFGCLTLVTHDPFWIALEYTLSNIVFGLILFAASLSQMGVLKYFFGGLFAIEDEAWHTLSFRWGAYFLLVAFVSQLLWQFTNYDIWLYFRFMSVLGMFAFGVAQIPLMKRTRLPGSSALGIRSHAE
jgi:intracellular septation protein